MKTNPYRLPKHMQHLDMLDPANRLRPPRPLPQNASRPNMTYAEDARRLMDRLHGRGPHTAVALKYSVLNETRGRA